MPPPPPNVAVAAPRPRPVPVFIGDNTPPEPVAAVPAPAWAPVNPADFAAAPTRRSFGISGATAPPPPPAPSPVGGYVMRRRGDVDSVDDHAPRPDSEYNSLEVALFGLARGLSYTSDGIQSWFMSPEALAAKRKREAYLADLKDPGEDTTLGRSAQFVGEAAPWFTGLGGILISSAAAGGHFREAALERGDSWLSAAAQGIGVGALSAAVPHAVGRVGGRALGRAGGAVGNLLPKGETALAKAVGETTTHTLSGAATGLGLAASEAAVLLTAGHPDEALERAKHAPTDMLVMGSMGGGIRAVQAGAGLPAAFRGQAEQARRDAAFSNAMGRTVAAVDTPHPVGVGQVTKRGFDLEAEQARAIDAESLPAAEPGFIAPKVSETMRPVAFKVDPPPEVRPESIATKPDSRPVEEINAENTLRLNRIIEEQLAQKKIDEAETRAEEAKAAEEQAIADTERSAEEFAVREGVAAAQERSDEMERHGIDTREPAPRPLADHIETLGGIRRPGKRAGGEYDYVTEGSMPDALRRKVMRSAERVPSATGGRWAVKERGLGPDVIAKQLHMEGVGDGTVETMWKNLDREHAAWKAHRAKVKEIRRARVALREAQAAAKPFETREPRPAERVYSEEAGAPPLPLRGKLTPGVANVRRGPNARDIADLPASERVAALASIKNEAVRAKVRAEVVAINKSRRQGEGNTPTKDLAEEARIANEERARAVAEEETPITEPTPVAAREAGDTTPATPAATPAPAPKPNALTGARFRQQLSKAHARSGMSHEQAAEATDAAYAIVRAAADVRGEHVDAFVSRIFRAVTSRGKSKEGQVGGAEFEASGRALVKVLKGANESTAVHELAHVFRRHLRASDMAVAERELGVVNGQWKESHEEAFARKFEKWLAQGKPSNNALAPVFTKFVTWMKSIYASVKDSPLEEDLSPALARVFDSIVSPGIGRKGLDGPEPTAKAPEPTAKAPEPTAKAPELEGQTSMGVRQTAAPAKPAPTAVEPPSTPPKPAPTAVEPPSAPPKPADAAPAPGGKPETTGVKNEVSADTRARLDLPSRETPDGKTFDMMYREGKDAIVADPHAPHKLLAVLLKNPSKVITDRDVGMMVAHRVDLENDLHSLRDAVRTAEAAGDPNGVLVAQANLERHYAALEVFTETMEHAGTVSARAFVARRIMSNLDHSLSGMSAKARDAKGSKLTDEEQGRVDELFQMVNDAEKAKRARLQKLLDKLEERRAAKDYAPKTREKEAYQDSETLALQMKLEKAKRLWKKELREYLKANRTTGEKWADALKGSPGLFKGLKASLDNSAIFRQGWRVMFTNPIIWGRNAGLSFVDMVQTFRGKEVMDAIHARMELSPYYEHMKRAKLAIRHSEEEIGPGWLEHIPSNNPLALAWNKTMGRVFKASSTAYQAFQYRNRIDVFEKMMRVAENSGVDITDAKQLRSIGRIVNSLTGRANFGAFEGKWGETANFALFAPRKLLADVQMFSNVVDPTITGFARKHAALNLVKAVGGTAAVMVLANAIAPGSIELDPRSADFGKIRIGNTRYDVTGGVAPLLHLAARLATGWMKRSTDDRMVELNKLEGYKPPTKKDAVDRFFVNKASPVMAVMYPLLTGRQREEVKGKPVAPTVGSQLETLIAPMGLAHLYDLLGDERLTTEEKVAGALADFVGIGSKTY